jgi:hypothetical protein
VENKKWQATYIAPLQPPTLAIFRSWGSSAGAGRIRPAAANVGVYHLSFAGNHQKKKKFFEKDGHRFQYIRKKTRLK